MPDLVKVEYQQTGQSSLVNELGMRENILNISLTYVRKRLRRNCLFRFNRNNRREFI